MTDLALINQICEYQVAKSNQCFKDAIAAVEPELVKNKFFELLPKDKKTFSELGDFFENGRIGKYLRNNNDKVIKDSLDLIDKAFDPCGLYLLNQNGNKLDEEGKNLIDETGNVIDSHFGTIYNCEELCQHNLGLLILEMFNNNGFSFSYPANEL